MLVELGLVEQRYRAVLEVLNGGATVTDVARRYGVVRQTVHTWLREYANHGLAGLVDGSSRPARCPHQMGPEVEALVVEWRRAHPTWGPRTLVNRLAREGVEPLPSRSAVYRALVRHQLIDPTRRRRRRSDYKRWERARAMELWQMDITGGVRLVDGTRPSVIRAWDARPGRGIDPGKLGSPTRAGILAARRAPTRRPELGSVRGISGSACPDGVASVSPHSLGRSGGYGMDIEEFYDANPARRSSEEVEFGRDWSDTQGNRCEISWVVDNGELYVMISPVEPIVTDPVGDEFVQPLPTEAVRVEVLQVIPRVTAWRAFSPAGTLP